MTEQKTVTPLQLDDVDVLFKRVAGNFEKHGDTPVPVLDITWEAVVPPAVMTGLLGAYCERVLFNSKGELLEPSEVFKRSTMPVPIEEDLVAQFVSFTLSDNIVREFGEEPDEGEDPAPSQLCPITKIQYEPKLGGGVWLGATTRIRPRDASELWAFLEHQGRHARLTISDSAIKVGNGKQQSLPLNGGGRAEPGPGFAAARAAASSTDTCEPAQNASPANDGAERSADAGGESAPASKQEPPKEPAPSAKNGHALDDIGPKTREEIERHAKRRGARPIDGRRGAH